MKKWLKRIGGIIALGFIALQLANPSHKNPPVLPGHDLMATNAPPEFVATVLRNSCYDCHSFETKWPWYSYVAPVSFYLARDVNTGRTNLNFSEWPHDDDKRVRKRWRHIADDIESGDMPMPTFTRFHPQTRLSDQQRTELIKWARGQADADQ